MDPYPSPEQPPGSCSAWQVLKTHWQSEDRLPVYLFFAIVFMMTIPLVSLHMVYTYWYNYFYEVLQEYDEQGLVKFAVVFFSLSSFYMVVGLYKRYVSKFVGERLRRWLTHRVVANWLHKRYQAKHRKQAVLSLIHFSFDLSSSLIWTISTFLALTYLIWQSADDLTISLGHWGIVDLHVYLMWLGAAYALIGTYYRMKSGRSLLSNAESQWREAAFQFANDKQGRKKKNKRSVKSQTAALTPASNKQILAWLCRVGIYQIALILPLVMAVSNGFYKIILIMWLIQSLQAFNRGQGSLTYVMHAYPAFAKSGKK